MLAIFIDSTFKIFRVKDQDGNPDLTQAWKNFSDPSEKYDSLIGKNGQTGARVFYRHLDLPPLSISKHAYACLNTTRTRKVSI